MLMSGLFALVCVEAGLRLFGDDSHYVWPPNLERRLAPRSDVLPGVVGGSRFVTNERGIRAPALSDDDEFRILAIGGSTTECYYLDQHEAWPHLLMTELTSRSGLRVWTGNVGRSGHSSRHHALQVERLLDELPDIDMVVVLVGLNDLLFRLKRHDSFLPLRVEPPAYTQELHQSAFARGPGRNAGEPALKQTEIWQLLRRAKRGLSGAPRGHFQDDGGVYVARERSRRAAAIPHLDSLPDLSAPLADYARTLHRIVSSLDARGVAAVLVTQPTLWAPDLDPRLSSLLWFGERGDTSEFYSVGALASGMTRYNERLLQVCETSNAICVDLAMALPKDTTVFYDDAHFNEAGARRVAGELADALLAAAPRLRGLTTSRSTSSSGLPEHPFVVGRTRALLTPG